MDTYELQQGHILWSGDREIDNQIKRILSKRGKMVYAGFKPDRPPEGKIVGLAVDYNLLFIGE